MGGDSEAVSYPQAYHTSCREGLAGHSGFQFNAASSSISPELLDRLASAHAGYHVPRDMPREPSEQELVRFPVSLKSREVDGTPVVSQTVYVGREFRGRDGEPDTGRFGNYFSHIVLADPTAAEPFGGLLAIELWKAPHWERNESQVRDLPELVTLEPGRSDLPWALEQLPSPALGWHGAVLDGVLGAIEGGPRVVLVEADSERSAAWVAWVTFALPSDLARRLSFTTFDGQPRHAQDLHLCVTSPGCDVGFAEHELDREVLLLEPAASTAPGTGRLYARVATALAQDGPDALAAAVARPSDGDAVRRGAQFALATGLVTLAAEEHLPSILQLLVELAVSGTWDLAEQTAQRLPAVVGSEETLRGWWNLHAAARQATAAPARVLADQALERLIPRLAEIPAELSDISSEAPTSPSPALLAAWLGRVEDDPGGSGRAALLKGGQRLGLIGCNVALDRRVAWAIADTIDASEMKQTLTDLAIGGVHQDVVDEVIGRLARDAFADQQSLPKLQEALSDPALVDTTRRLAAQTVDFDERMVWERLRVEADRDQLPDALATLVPIAVQVERTSDVNRVFAPAGPVSVEDHAMLLRAFKRAGVTAPVQDVDAALHVLAHVALTDTARGCPLIETLRATAPRGSLRAHPVFLAWVAACSPPRANFAEWCEWVAAAAAAPVAPAEQLPDERYQELWALAGSVTVAGLDTRAAEDHHRRGASPGEKDPADDAFADYCAGVAILARTFGADWPHAVSRALERELSKGQDRSWFGATAFLTWGALPAGSGNLLETALPEALESQSPRRLVAIQERLGEREQEEFARWLERHPPRAGVSGTVSRLLRRDGRRA
jgi:hypothetical protein